jgi:hypothetical protein
MQPASASAASTGGQPVPVERKNASAAVPAIAAASKAKPIVNTLRALTSPDGIGRSGRSRAS